jgi:phage gp29-like protein
MDRKQMSQTGKSTVPTAEIASTSTDPNFYGALRVLPNPDEVLRKLGKTDEAYNAIMGDGHVQGELRSIRAGLLSYEYRLQAGGEQPADLHALELCEKFLARDPAPDMSWSDVLWNIGTAALRGRSIHEVVWQQKAIEGYTLPVKLIDRPLRRFPYNQDRECRLLTKGQPTDGIALPDKAFLITRHMPSYQNPYGMALFSGCFWPFTFKHGGWKFFYKFCEKYGIPWAVGKHPRGTPKAEIDALIDALAAMIEDAVGTIPDDGSVDLITTGTGMAQLPQERLITMANKEMSKCLTSQTLATELNGEGSQAAAQTHRGREQDVQETDRDMVCRTMNKLLTWVTEVNIAGAVPPTFEFYEEEEVQQQTADFIDKARTIVSIPQSWAYRMLQIPEPEEGEAVLSMGNQQPAIPAEPAPKVEFNSTGVGHDFNAGTGDELDALTAQASKEADAIIADMAAPIRELLFSVGSPAEFRDGLLKLYPKIDDSRLAELNSQVLQAGYLKGASDAEDGE